MKTILILGALLATMTAAFAADPGVGLGAALDSAGGLRQSYVFEGQRNYEGAIRAMAPTYNATPKDFFVNLRLGWLNSANGNYKNALTHYEAALKARPKSVTALLGRMYMLTIYARWGEAETVGREVVAIQPTDLTANLRLANVLITEKKYGEAAELLAPLVANYPENVELLNTVAWSQRLAGNPDAAGEAAQAVLAISPDNAIAQSHAREIAKIKQPANAD